MTSRWRLLRVFGSIALLATVVAFLPAGSLTGALRQASPRVLGVALVVFVVCHLAAALKWRMLMGPQNDVSILRAFQAHFTGLVGNLSPLGMIGGDIARAGVAISGSARPAAIVVTSVVDRLVDSMALLVLALIGFVWLGGQSDTGRVVLWGAGTLLLVSVPTATIGYLVLKRTRSPRLAGIREASRLMVDQPGLIARALLLSVSIQGALVSANAYIGADVGVESSFGAWLMAWPAAKLAAYLPVGIAGIGLRESALVVLLRPLGGAAGPVMASGLLWDVVLIAGTLAGWAVLCLPRGLRPARLRRLQTP